MESAKTKKEKLSESNVRNDPFAVDIFRGQAKPGKAVDARLHSVKTIRLPDGVTRDWSAELPQIAAVEGPSQKTPAYPEWLETSVNRHLLPSIKEFTDARERDPHFEVLSFEDIESERALEKSASGSNIFVRFMCCNSEGLMIISNEFASELIDKILKGPGGHERAENNLSKIEKAICEYMVASAFSSFNRALDRKNRVVLGEIMEEADFKNPDSRVIEIVGDLLIGATSGMVSLLLPFDLVESLNEQFAEKQQRPSVSKLLANVVGEPRIGLKVGLTKIQAVELPFLEPEDIVLITDPVEKWWGGDMDCGSLTFFAGLSSNIAVSGTFIGENSAGGQGFRISDAVVKTPRAFLPRYSEFETFGGRETVEIENSDEPTEGRVDDVKEIEVATGNTDLDEGGLIALENVMVDLRVQVAGRKISLSELSTLHAGQIIDLGCRPEDPVELIAENSDRPIASGELVKLEGQLGVRITKVFV